MITVKIDNNKITVEEGTTIMEAARRAGITIPSLCHHRDLDPRGLCRLCMVEVSDLKTPVPACTYKIDREFQVTTSSPALRAHRQINLDLILSSHNDSCATCVRGGNCELQALSEIYASKGTPYGKEIDAPRYDTSSAAITRDYSKCIQCRRCVETCEKYTSIGIYSSQNRGWETQIGSLKDIPLRNLPCINCGQCINRCPTGALTERDSVKEVWKALQNPDKHVVIQIAPAPRAAVGECFGYEAGTSWTYEINTALKIMGFDTVFDTCFTADLTIMEEGTELLTRIMENRDLPLFTSCSPGWVKYIEHFFPEGLKHLSSAKSPHEMFGAIIKTHYAENTGIKPEDIVVVSLMPCIAKKFEIHRPELTDSGFQDVDYVLTTRELGRMMKESGISLKDLQKTAFDDPFGDETGSGVIFASTGGVMESALRAVHHITTGTTLPDVLEALDSTELRGFKGVKYAEIPIDSVADVPEILKHKMDSFSFLEGQTLRVAVCHGTANARKVLDDIKEGGIFSKCHFIEFMACPGGCIGGGGQPIPTDEDIRRKRREAIFNTDSKAEVKASSYNPAVLKIYSEFFNSEPGGERAHKLLHTTYKKRLI